MNKEQIEIEKRITLEQFLNMKPEDQCKVTHLDLSLASNEELAKMRSLTEEEKDHERL